MARTLILAADPGVSGGLCLMTKKGIILALSPMPINTFLKGSKRRSKNNPTGKGEGKTRVVDEIGLRDWICARITSEDKVVGAIELLRGLPPEMGGSANFSLGDSFGILKGAFALAGFRITLIPAKHWQHSMFPQRAVKHDKAKSIALARQLFPDWSHVLRTQSCDGLAEAALIAEHVRRTTFVV